MKSRDPQSDNRFSLTLRSTTFNGKHALGEFRAVEEEKGYTKDFSVLPSKKMLIMKGIEKTYSLGEMIYLPNFRSSPEIFIQTNDVMGFTDEVKVR